MFLARKITRAKWAASKELSEGEIPADAVTVDLKTRDNSLSFWECASDKARDVESAALAIAAGRDYIDRLDIIWLSDDELRAGGIALTQTIGRTPVTDMANSHVDVRRLDYVRLGIVAQKVIAAIESDRYWRLSKARIRELIADAVGQGRINFDSLNAEVRSELVHRI